MWASPVTTLVSTQALVDWMREKVANGVAVSVDFAGLAVFLVSHKATWWIKLECHLADDD